MVPKARVETLAKSRAGHLREWMADFPPPGAHRRVESAQVEAIIAEWPAAPKKVAKDAIGLGDS